MTPNQFWYDETYLLDVYVEAYNNSYKKRIEEIKTNGHYVNIAVLSAIKIALGEGKGFQYYDFLKEEELTGQTKETKEKEFNEEKNFWSSLKHRKD